jgi:hypothetical protein
MSPSRSWRERVSAGVLVAFVVDALFYIAKLITPWRLVSSHVGAVVVMDEIGFVVCLLTFFLAPISLTGWRMISIVIGSVLLGYLWFASVAWWVMVK